MKNCELHLQDINMVNYKYENLFAENSIKREIKIAFEGGTIVDEFNNYDRSREIQVYKKVGVVCMLANNICAYCDTSLVGQMATWNYDGVTGKVVTYDGRLDGTI